METKWLLMSETLLLGYAQTLGILLLGIFTVVWNNRRKKDVKEVKDRVIELDVKVDGRLTELLESTKSDQRQQGNTEGQEKVRSENIALASDLDKQTETIIAAVKEGQKTATPEPNPVVIVKNLDK